jgi:hypothetical protein
MKKILVLLLMFFCVGSGLAFEKVGTTSFQFLKVMTDARSTGMAEAQSAVTNSSEAVFWNPAALTQVQNFDISLSYLDWLLDTSHSSVTAAYAVQNIGTFGFHAMATNVGEIEVTTVDALGFVDGVYNPGLTGETITPSALSVGLLFARQLTDKLSFGITAKYVEEDLSVDKASNIVFDGGLTFDTGFKSLKVAAAVRHFGSEVKYIDQSYPLPQTFTIGLAANLFAPQDGFLFDSSDHTLLVAYDMSQPRDYNQQHHLGFEYGLKDFLFLRTGYKFNFDEEGFAFGFGVKMIGLRIDYSYSDFGQYLDSVHRFSVGFTKK